MPLAESRESPPTFDMTLVRPRAQVLARADRQLRAELVALRRAAGLTQRQLADRMGVSQQAVQKLERYDSDPKLSTLRRYANAVEAVVEHRVTPDTGQSAALASPSRWDDQTRLTLPAPTTLGEGTFTEHWPDRSRSRFTLAS